MRIVWIRIVLIRSEGLDQSNSNHEDEGEATARSEQETDVLQLGTFMYTKCARVSTRRGMADICQVRFKNVRLPFLRSDT